MIPDFRASYPPSKSIPGHFRPAHNRLWLQLFMETNDEFSSVLILVPFGVLVALELIRVLHGFPTRSEAVRAVLRQSVFIPAEVR